MRYELISQSLSVEVPVFENDEPTTKYFVSINLQIKDTESLNTANFFYPLVVISDNSQDGFSVDEQRELAVSEYMASINV